MSAPEAVGGGATAEDGGPVEDRLAPRPVTRSERVYDGAVWDVVSDHVDLGGDEPVQRDRIDHPGAVGILALDEQGRVLVLRQYRHAVQHELWEIPAGLLDHPGEDPVAAAARELYEEADLRAGRLDLLAEWYSSPGGSDEAIRVYLARDLTPVGEDERFEREHEEKDMPVRWVDLDELRDAVLAGRLHNPTAVVGVLAAAASRDGGWASLRQPGSPWPTHKHHRG